MSANQVLLYCRGAKVDAELEQAARRQGRRRAEGGRGPDGGRGQVSSQFRVQTAAASV